MKQSHLENAAELAAVCRLARHLESQIRIFYRERDLTDKAFDKIKEVPWPRRPSGQLLLRPG